MHLQKPLKEKLDRLQKQQIIVPLDADETAEWCNSVFVVPKVVPGPTQTQQGTDQANA